MAKKKDRGIEPKWKGEKRQKRKLVRRHHRKEQKI